MHYNSDEKKILQELNNTALINYRLLRDKKNLTLYPEILIKLLFEAEKKFQAILHLPKKKQNFQNSIGAYFDKDRELSILYGFIQSINSTDSTPETRKIIQDFQPEFISYVYKTTLNKKYYQQLKYIDKNSKNNTEKRSIKLLLKGMEIAGISLPAEKRKQLEKINKKLGILSEKFENNVIDSRKDFYHEFKNDQFLKEMPKNTLQQAKITAEKKKSKAKYVFNLSPPSLIAILKYCSSQEIRKLFYQKNFTIASEGKYDNRPVILEILNLRHKKAELLGHRNYINYTLQQRMAKNMKEIQFILHKIHKKAYKKAQNELYELQKFSQLKTLEEWDISYYSEKLRQKKYNITEEELKEYFPLKRVTEGLFEITEKLFGLTFKKLKVKSYNREVESFEIYKNKELISYYIIDFFTRSTKKGGAWCNNFRTGKLNNKKFITPIVINVMNFAKGIKKNDALLSHRDVETFFHEFGHALHIVLSSKNHENLQGFDTEWDFVEFPSQLLENWCWEKESLDLFTQHFHNKKPLPEKIIKKLQKSKTFMSGYKVMRQIEFAFLDIFLHFKKPPTSIQKLDDICQNIVKKYSVINKIPEYKMYASFSHIFAGGYAAGYYSYIWAEILEADCFAAIKRKGIFKKQVSSEFCKKILIPGARKNGMNLFKDFMKRKPKPDAFIKKHHL